MSVEQTLSIIKPDATRRNITGDIVARFEKAGLRVEKKKTEDFPVPDELTAKFKKDAKFRKAFEALTPGRQRGYLYHFAQAKQSATRAARIEKAAPGIYAGRGFLERPGTREMLERR